MNNTKKLILRILISTSVILILLVGLFIFVIKKNGITEFDKKNYSTEKPVIKLKGTDRIPKTAFWIEKNGKGNWFNVDWMHNHKNNATISIYDKSGELEIKSNFMKICPIDELKFIENLKTEIDYYDGKNIQLKDNCYLLKN
ncbi:hypothetical protein VP395_15785 [Mariniflexile soesokkakense]|uniref:MORN repeat protein n=1 Tax=Mariniflexile soesokkakense TaxID=1343160 RepID=A0ABV0ADN8_9FLAO